MKEAGKNTESLKRVRMSMTGVVALVFSFISAGAFGIEEAIAASGPGVTIAILALFPFLWSFPLCEAVSELGSILPTEGGIYSWAREAFGEFWGWQAGLWGAITTWLCQSEYVALIVGYLGKMVSLSAVEEYALKVGIVLFFSVFNILGLNWLEKLETVFMFLIIAAFGAVTVVGFANCNYNPVMPLFNPENGIFHSIGDGIAIIIWMYMGYECMSNMAREVDSPQIIPKAMRISNPLICLSYILPTLAALAAVGSWKSWTVSQFTEGTVGYADVLIRYIGSWTGWMFIIVAILANCSIFCSYIAHGSRAFFVMADDHMFPKFMCRLDRRGIPVLSIIILGLFTIFTCQFDFVTLVMATNPIQMYLYLLLIACVLRLRKRYPAEERKKIGLSIICGGRFGLYAFAVLIVLISLLAIFVNGLDYFLAGYCVIFGGLFLYIMFKIVYKGRYNDDPVMFPLNQTTHLGVGDLRDIGVYTGLFGLMSLAGTAFFCFYEGDYGEAYYLETYGQGFFSSFHGMLGTALALGVVCTALGSILYRIAQKQEGSRMTLLEEMRFEALDAHLMELHGRVPRAEHEGRHLSEHPSSV